MDALAVRDADYAELDHLARLWHDGWHEAHAAIVPADLTRLRSLESFRHRLERALPHTRVVGPCPEPVGFCTIKTGEVEQLFVAERTRGSGAAKALMDDAEARLVARGVELAWLACAIGNVRAARFYEKCGWHCVGTVSYAAETPYGEYRLDVWRYEKRLQSGRAPGPHPGARGL